MTRSRTPSGAGEDQAGGAPPVRRAERGRPRTAVIAARYRPAPRVFR